MKQTSSVTIFLKNVLKNKAPHSTTCFIDETEVAQKECVVLMEERTEDQKLDVWDK